jgi:3-dehydroquinate dehydratase/shikimate dehydrogenase
MLRHQARLRSERGIMSSGGERICVVIGRTRHKMVQAEIQEAAKRGATLIEVRLDFLSRPPDFKRLLANKPCPMVATVRRVSDGGRWKGTEEQRMLLLRQCVVAGFDWVDIESDVVERIPRFRDVKRIVSYHNMREVPDDIEKIHARMCDQDADLVKIAVRAQRPSDNLRVLKLLRQPRKPTVAFCMGELGLPSRILGGRLAMPFTYAAFNKERGIAPGLPSFDDLKKIYHFDRIDSHTAIYGVIGDPVAHSLSPLMHNQLFQYLGINAVYLPFRVARGDVEEFLKLFDSLPVRGYSVTLPHKESVVSLVRQRDPLAGRIHAANTLVRMDSKPQHQGIMTPESLPRLGEQGAEGQAFIAYNTDAQAALDSLLAHLPPSPDGAAAILASRTVLILGAGGVARAIAHALHREGAALTISNRTQDRAIQLAQDIGCRAIGWESRHRVTCDTVINCSSIGMEPNFDESPLHPSFLRSGLVVFDCVYTPENTLLIKEARNRGCLVITGVDMFVRQAALQFRLFTGREPPLDFMRKVVRRALSPLTAKDEP